jgi:hypothetical protein
VTRQLVVTVSAALRNAALTVTGTVVLRGSTDRSNRASYRSSSVITVTRLTRDRGRARPVRLGRTSRRRTAVTRVTYPRVAQGHRRNKVNIVIDMRRLAVHCRVVRVRFVTSAAVRRTRRIRTVSSRSYMGVVSTTASRTGAVTKGAVTGTRHRTPRVSYCGSIARSVLVAIVRAARAKTAVRQVALARVLRVRHRSTAHLNSTVDYCRCRTGYKVCVGSVVRMARRTIDR